MKLVFLNILLFASFFCFHGNLWSNVASCKKQEFLLKRTSIEETFWNSKAATAKILRKMMNQVLTFRGFWGSTWLFISLVSSNFVLHPTEELQWMTLKKQKQKLIRYFHGQSYQLNRIAYMSTPLYSYLHAECTDNYEQGSYFLLRRGVSNKNTQEWWKNVAAQVFEKMPTRKISFCSTRSHWNEPKEFKFWMKREPEAIQFIASTYLFSVTEFKNNKSFTNR